MNRFSVFILPDEFKALRKLPGNIRHRIRRAIDELAENPTPPHTQ